MIALPRPKFIPRSVLNPRQHRAHLESPKNATLRTLERYATGLVCALEISVVAKSR
jgi:hypothetical protein